MTSHMLDSKEDARVGVCKIIRDGTKKEFDEIVERLEGCAKQRVSSKEFRKLQSISKITGQRPKDDFGEEMACVHAVPKGM